MLNEKNLMEELKELLEEDSDLLEESVNEINSYDGSFSDEEWIPMEELESYLEGYSAMDILNMGFFGEDEDSSKSFNPNRDYFKFNAYRNLVSTNYPDYSDLIDDVIDKILENYEDYDLPEVIEELIEKYSFNYELELDNENDFRLVPEINDYDILIDGNTIYCKENDGDAIENILIDKEVEYC